MKKCLAVIFSLCSTFTLFSQLVTAHIDYAFLNNVERKTDDVFFLTYIRSGLDSVFFKTQLDIAGRRILKATSSGQPINRIYTSSSPAKLYSSDVSLSDFAGWNPAEFDASALSPVNANHPNSYTKTPFVKDGNAAVSQGRFRIEPDGKYFFDFDTAFTNKKKNKYQLVPRPLYVSGVMPSFSEEWSFDMTRGTFRKNIFLYGFAFSRAPWWRYEQTRFLLECPPDTSGFDLLLRKNVVYDVAISRKDAQSLHGVNQNNLYPYGWTDLAGEMGNIDESPRNKLIGALINYAFHHLDKVYPVLNGSPDTSRHFSNVYQLESLVTQWDSTNQVEDPNNPGTYILAPLKYSYQAKQVYALRFYEDWYFDKKACCIRKKVRYVSMLFDVNYTTKEPVLRDAGFLIKVN